MLDHHRIIVMFFSQTVCRGGLKGVTVMEQTQVTKGARQQLLSAQTAKAKSS